MGSHPTPASPGARSDNALIATIVVGAIVVVVVVSVLATALLGARVLPDPNDLRGAITVNVGGEDINWTLTISSTQSGMALTVTNLVIKRADGSLALAAAPLSTYRTPTNGVSYVQVRSNSTVVTVGDQLLIDSRLYLRGYRFEILYGVGLLTSGELR